VADTGIEPVTSVGDRHNTVLSTPQLSTKTVRGRPPISSQIRARCHALCQSANRLYTSGRRRTLRRHFQVHKESPPDERGLVPTRPDRRFEDRPARDPQVVEAHRWSRLTGGRANDLGMDVLRLRLSRGLPRYGQPTNGRFRLSSSRAIERRWTASGPSAMRRLRAQT
jgi:hypothetical protein